MSTPLIDWLDLFGVAVFAISGSLAAGRKQMDLFGAVVLATVTALGGGSLRDLLLGLTPVFWIHTPLYLWICLGAALTTFTLVHFRSPPRRLLLVADALGLAVFTVIGTQTALSQGVATEVALIMGMMTGVVGGVIRDLLAGEVPLILRREIYATAALLGAASFLTALHHGLSQPYASALAILLTFSLRLAAIYWRLSLPRFPLQE